MKARNWWLIFVSVVVVAGAVGWTTLRHSSKGRRAELASGYVAHVVCSCRYLGNRDMRSCAGDLEPGMEIVQMKDNTTAKRITASVPWVVERSATFVPGEGCTLDK